MDDEHGVELSLPVSQYEMMDAFEQLRAKPAEDVYWQVDEFYHCDFLAPHLDERTLFCRLISPSRLMLTLRMAWSPLSALTPTG